MSQTVHDALNPQQRDAVFHRDGPLAVLAGPGTGKTRVIIHRIARLIEDDRVEPETVLAVTYTVRAAEELRHRLAGLIGGSKADRVQALTFHSFARRLVVRFRDLLGLDREPEPADSARQRRLLREVIRRADLKGRLVARGWDAIIDDALAMMSRLRQQAITPVEFARRVAERRTAVEAGEVQLDAAALEAERAMLDELEQQGVLFQGFEAALRERNLTTFDDDIARSLDLLRGSSHASAIVRADCRHVLVDEFQDVNLSQIELLSLLAPASTHPDLCVVGDDDQSIYLFRGADDLAFHRFARSWPRHRIVPLEANHRSAAPIVDAANRVIARANARFAPEKRIVSHAKPEDRRGAVVECVRVPSEEHDGPLIAAMLRASRAAEPDKAWKNYAVIARTHLDLLRVGAALEIEGIPSVQARKPSPMHDEAVKDLFAWITLLLEPTQAAIAGRLLRRPPISLDVTITTDVLRDYRMAAWRSETGEEPAPGPFVPWLVARLPDDARVARLGRLWDELVQVASHDPADSVVWRIIARAELAHAELLPERERARRVTSLVDVLRFVRGRMEQLDPPGDLRAFHAYFNDLDPNDRDRLSEVLDRTSSTGEEASFDDCDAVRLLTAHASKGLEFDTVFIPRVNPGHGYPMTSGRAEEELPNWLADRAGDVRTIKERKLDEERRLFYVACTRAERRLVMLTKETKAPSRSTHFAQELMGEPIGDHGPIVLARSADDIVTIAEDDAITASLAGDSGEDRLRDIVGRLRREARLEAAVALDRADSPDANPASLGPIDLAMHRAALLLAFAAHLERRRTAPTWASDHAGELSLDLDAMREAMAGHALDATSSAFPGLRPPLRLSYSAINDYLDCPRCFYLTRELRLGDDPSEAMNIGTASHEALRQYYEQWRKADSEGRPAPSSRVLLDLTRQTFMRLASGPAPAGSLEQLLAQMAQYHERLHDPTANILYLEHTVRFPYTHRGVEHSIEAKLDRVDQVGGGFRIVDYKSGQPKKDLLEPKRDDLQLGIYAMALPTLLGDAGPFAGTAEYWLLQTCERGVISLSDLKIDRIHDKINRAIEGMLEGRWNKGKDCRGRCEILGPG